MSDDQTMELVVQIGLEDGNARQLDRMTCQLLNEVRRHAVESAELMTAGLAPEGTKAVDPVTLGAIAMVVLPAVLPKLIEFLQAWVLRGQGRTVKIKGQLGGHAVEFEGTPEDLKALLATLPLSQATDGPSSKQLLYHDRLQTTDAI